MYLGAVWHSFGCFICWKRPNNLTWTTLRLLACMQNSWLDLKYALAAQKGPNPRWVTWGSIAYVGGILDSCVPFVLWKVQNLTNNGDRDGVRLLFDKFEAYFQPLLIVTNCPPCSVPRAQAKCEKVHKPCNKKVGSWLWNAHNPTWSQVESSPKLYFCPHPHAGRIKDMKIELSYS